MAIAELTVDAEAVYEALDRQRRHRRMRRREVAAVLGVSPSAYTAWGMGGGVNAAVLIRAFAWLERDISDIRDFIQRDIPP